MAADLIGTLATASEGDEVRITLATDGATVRGVTFESPIVTRVAAVSEETVDARQKDVEIEGIVDRRILRLVPLGDDDAHAAYVLETRSPVVGSGDVVSGNRRGRVRHGSLVGHRSARTRRQKAFPRDRRDPVCESASSAVVR